LLDVFIVAGETSGDRLGGPLMAALRASATKMRFRGVGGPTMAAQGLTSQFPMSDITAIGLGPVVAKLPLILRRLRETTAAILAEPPDLLILIDSPDFTHRVARRVRRALPNLAIVKYVAPTVWAWRPGRARAMKPDFDRVLALLPFEPEAMQRLGGPPTTYVGHPLLEQLAELRPSADDMAAREREPPLVLILPGSRRSELGHLAGVFGAAAGLLSARRRVDLVLATPPALAGDIAAAIVSWPAKPRVITDDAEKFAAFRRARGAIAASGTVTLELALAQVPMVAAYRISMPFDRLLVRMFAQIDTPILPNIALGERAVPQFLQRDCRADAIAAAMIPLLDTGPERTAQLDAFARLEALLDIGGEAPSARAARVLMETYEAKRGQASLGGRVFSSRPPRRLPSG
jgi:lipid-A-disaccharide synthase